MERTNLATQSPDKIADAILNFIKDNTVDEPFHIDNLRLGLGLCLSSIHATMIYSAKGEDSQKKAVETAFDTVERMISCIKRDCEGAGVQGVQIIKEEIEVDDPSSEVTH